MLSIKKNKISIDEKAIKYSEELVKTLMKEYNLSEDKSLKTSNIFLCKIILRMGGGEFLDYFIKKLGGEFIEKKSG